MTETMKEPVRDVPAFPENINAIVVLSTGRRLWAYRHGLLFAEALEIPERQGEWFTGLTHAEGLEIADIAIRQWENFKKALHESES